MHGVSQSTLSFINLQVSTTIMNFVEFEMNPEGYFVVANMFLIAFTFT